MNYHLNTWIKKKWKTIEIFNSIYNPYFHVRVSPPFSTLYSTTEAPFIKSPPCAYSTINFESTLKGTFHPNPFLTSQSTDYLLIKTLYQKLLHIYILNVSLIEIKDTFETHPVHSRGNSISSREIRVRLNVLIYWWSHLHIWFYPAARWIFEALDSRGLQPER